LPAPLGVLIFNLSPKGELAMRLRRLGRREEKCEPASEEYHQHPSRARNDDVQIALPNSPEDCNGGDTN
jgi:hypothetical protein